MPEALDTESLLKTAAGALALVADDLPPLRETLADAVFAHARSVWRGDADPLLAAVGDLSDALALAESALRMLKGRAA